MDDNSIGDIFGKRLKEIRSQKKVTQERLALDSGYHPTYISMLENGKHVPSIETVIKLSKSLSCSIIVLLDPFID